MRKRTKRRIFPLVNPLGYVLDSIKPVDHEAMERLRLVELCAIDAFSRGVADINNWRDLNNMLNLCEHMARNGCGVEALEACKNAQEALAEAAVRFDKTGKMGTTGAGLNAFRELYEYHDLQRQSVTVGEYEKHIKDTINRIKSKAPEVMDVCDYMTVQ